MNFFSRLFSQKESQARIALTVQQAGQPQSTKKNLLGYSTQGYEKNVYVYRCTSMIARACAGIKWDLSETRTGSKPVYVETHPLLDLLASPNPLQGGAGLFESFMAYYQLTGNTYLEAKRKNGNGVPLELWSARPDCMRVVPDKMGYPAWYEFRGVGETVKWLVDPITLQSNILHMKTFHPTDQWYGLSPIDAALLSMEASNSANRYNLDMLNSGGTPSGIISVKVDDANPHGQLSDKQLQDLKQDLDRTWGLTARKGRPYLLEGGLSWQQISLSPKDMSYIQGKKMSAEEIALAFGVPLMLLGLGEMTYKNYAEARLAFYEETVLPLMDMVEFEFNRWLVPMMGDSKRLKLCYDKDDIDALAIKRESKYSMFKDVNYVSLNEKREATGYEKVDGGDVYIINGVVVNKPSDAITDTTPSTDEPPVDETTSANDSESETDDLSQSNQQTFDDDEEKVSQRDAELEGSSNPEDLEWKLFNAINKNERRMSARRQNYRKDRLRTGFQRDLDSDFKDLKRDMIKASTGQKDARLVENALLKEIDKHTPEIKKTIERHIKYSVEDFGLAVFAEAQKNFVNFESKVRKGKWDDFAQRYINTRSGKAIKEIEGTSVRKVRAAVRRMLEESILQPDTEFDMAKELQENFEGLSPGRARTIARTEIQMASNESTLEAVKSLDLGPMQKEWVSTSDDGRNRQSHLDLDGTRVDIDDNFDVEGVPMSSPGDEAGGADNVCNCRCTLIFKAGG